MNAELNSDAPAMEPSLPSPRPKKSRWRTLLQLVLVVVIFGSGVVTGGALAMRMVRHKMKNFELESETMIERIHERLVWKYDLNEEQSAEAKQIVRNKIEDLIALRQEFRPRLAAEMGSFENEIAAIMDESQQTEWRENFRHFCEITFPGVYKPDAESGE
ncbi:hypothetical protein Pla110_02490 [Polystyrenella longa]|uniref:Uncharacterized protein n=1 Tax=Polystyrenella longa TaxID=2528007 RepID=A0A518CH40_9PLAN|nr:hypothetical protein [Polystyrenella longa]QDU78545.1 hypothetical protein Pla110_02490 [Polystyrenella longa]